VHQSSSPTPQLRGRLLLAYHRLRLSWHASRNGGGRPLALRQDGEFVRVGDGMRHIHVPHLSRVDQFRAGIDAQLASVAEKYVGGTGYVPREGDVVVDIGAGIGEFTLWCADAGAQVVAFEPDPLAFACLERNVASLPDVRVFSAALWKEHAQLRLHGSADTSESSLIEDGKNVRVTDVEAWPLDQLPAAVALPVIDFMKVDGEGVEPEILAGALRTLRRTRVISVDVSATDRRPNLLRRVEAVLEQLNFRALPREGSQAILALNAAMVGPFSSRVLDRRGS
jgi:FkbM family methyltransferase